MSFGLTAAELNTATYGAVAAAKINAMSFGLTAADMREKRRLCGAVNEAEYQARKAVCLPIWLALIRDAMTKRFNPNEPEVSVAVETLEKVIPEGVAKQFTPGDVADIKAAVEANNSEFTLVQERLHSWMCDCAQDEPPCTEFLVIRWSWE